MAETYPSKFGKYILLKPMARGGMGEIYLAATGEIGFQKFCVIKKVIAEKTDRVKANRFLDEAKVVLRLAHANLVPTFDAGEVDGEFFIAMELVEGKDLREIWNRCVRTRTRIPLDVALHVGREIARALAYVHSNGDLRLVHRDVAPPNILVSYFGEVKLTDFGLARSVLKQEQTAPGVVFGRASYLSPEQARGEVADSRTDIYSLGIVLWELVTGNQYLQLANLDPATAMSLVRHPRVQPPSSKAPWITPNLDALLMRALAPAREDRFQSAEEMRKALSDIIAQISPRADAERASDFLRGLYDTSIKEERTEREKLLAGSAALCAAPTGERPSAPRVPVPLAALELNSTKLQFPQEEGEASVVDFTGRVIDNRYRVLRKIGEGGMGTVYAGEHVEIGKDVAIKILNPAFSTQQDLVERFRREARAASRIGHPNIIDVTDFGSTEDGCAYFVMEHLDGIDLADVLSHERRLAPGRCCKIAIQICRALSVAHAAGVIHRDLKPENIFLVARDGQADFVKVLDFGIARSMGRARRLTNPGVAMGTPEYMAPEQAEGGAVDHRSDIFSVGALLYEMVTGSPPQRSRDKELIPPRGIKTDVPEELERIIVRALAPDPTLRYQSMAQLDYDLVKSMFGRPRAVAELLGLHEPEARGVVPTAEAPSVERAPAAVEKRHATPARRAPAPNPPEIPYSRETGIVSPRALAAEERGLATSGIIGSVSPSAGWRFLSTFAVLALVAVAAVPIYRRLPWNAHAPSGVALLPAASSAAPAATARQDIDPRAQRLRTGVAEVERLLGGRFTVAGLPTLEDRLARLRADGGGAIADALAERAKAQLVKAADEELDRGAIEAGVAHYRLALGLDPRGGGEATLVNVLHARAQAELSAGKGSEAVRWAREAIELDASDAAAHALLADSLHAAREDEEAVTEYQKALAAKPDDRRFAHGLLRARRALAASDAARARAPRAKKTVVTKTARAAVVPAPAVEAPAPQLAPDQAAQAPATDKTDSVEKTDKIEQVEKTEKIEKTEKADKPDDAEKAAPSDKAEKPDEPVIHKRDRGPKPETGADKPEPSASPEPAPGEQH
jgi:serine/threonine protein kinase/tetratricopeptide (TPR) repeat protein